MRYHVILNWVQDIENSRLCVIVNDAILSDFQETVGKRDWSQTFLQIFNFLFLGSGDTSTYFQMVGRRCSCKDALIILDTG